PRMADLVVERSGGRHDRAGRRQHGTDQILGAGLTRRAGHPDHRQTVLVDKLVDTGPGESSERGEDGRPRPVGVSGQRHRVGLPTVDRRHHDLCTGRTVDLAGHQCRRRARVQGSGDEIMTVDPFTRQGEEETSGLHAPGVELDGTGDGRRRVTSDQSTADYPGDLTEGEGDHDELSSVSPCRAVLPRRLMSSSAARARSSKGCTTPWISWPVSWPLPAITTTSPVRAQSIAAPIAAPRSPISSTCVRSPAADSAPARTAARIEDGSSVRGLSSVTTTR